MIENIRENILTYIQIYEQDPLKLITFLVDMAIVIFLAYNLLKIVKDSRAWQLIKGIALLIIATWLSKILNLNILNYILSAVMNWGVILLIIIFQPEIRRALEQLGTNKFTKLFGMDKDIATKTKEDIYKIAIAATELAKTKTGALIVIERNVSMGDIVSASGVAVDAVISSQLLINIFEDKTPLHDGAVIIRDNRVAAASCILPVTQSEIGQELGTRHRAAVGASEVSDAFIIVVSEETGKISIARDGKLEKAVSEAVFRQELLNLCEKTAPAGAKAINKIWRGMSRHDK